MSEVSDLVDAADDDDGREPPDGPESAGPLETGGELNVTFSVADELVRELREMREELGETRQELEQVRGALEEVREELHESRESSSGQGRVDEPHGELPSELSAPADATEGFDVGGES